MSNRFKIVIVIFLVINLLALIIWGESGIGVTLILSGIILIYGGKEHCLDYYDVIWREWWNGVFLIFIGLIIGIFGGCLCYDSSQFEDIQKAFLYEKNEKYVSNEHRIRLMNNCDSYIINKYYLPQFHKADVKEIMDYLLNNSSLEILNDFSNGDYFYSIPLNESDNKKEAAKKVKEICDIKYKDAISENTIGAWSYYRDSIMSFHKEDHISEDSINKKIKYLMNHGFDKEKSAWKNAKSVDEIWAYNEYLNKHPNGKHEKQAIDALVSLISAGNHGELPSMEQVYYGGGTTSDIDITNDTQYTLTLLYSGTESKRLVLPPHNSTNITLYNGTYAVAASVDATNVRNYAGTEHLSGGSYAVTYYISTTYGGSSLPYLSNPRY